MKTSFLAVLTTIFVLHYFYFHFIPLNDVHYLHYVVIGFEKGLNGQNQFFPGSHPVIKRFPLSKIYHSLPLRGISQGKILS